jgi:hypothetical protein
VWLTSRCNASADALTVSETGLEMDGQSMETVAM